MYAGTNKTVISGKAKAMKLMNPNLKIFAFMTDPVSRLFSHINMCIRSKWAFCKNQTLEQVRLWRLIVRVWPSDSYTLLTLDESYWIKFAFNRSCKKSPTICPSITQRNLWKQMKWNSALFIGLFKLAIMLSLQEYIKNTLAKMCISLMD